MLNTNQFGQEPVVGTLDLTSGGGNYALSVQIDPKSTGKDIVAGTALKLVDGGVENTGGVPLVDVADAADKPAFGALVYSVRKGKFQPGDEVNVSVRGSIQRFSAGEIMNGGVVVAVDVANPSKVKAVGSDARFGILLDKARAVDDIVRVYVDPAVTA